MKKTLNIILLMLVASACNFSDTFNFKNGDIIKGKVIRETGMDYVIKSELFGDFTVLKENVSKIDATILEVPAIKKFQKPVKISVLDFQVQSANPDYAFFGKGFAEFVAVELIKSKDIMLIDREHLSEVLKEQKLSLTGLMEEKDQIEIGKMIAVNYLVSGKIIDIMNRITITYKVVDTITGETVLQQSIEENPSRYDYISAYITKDVLTKFDAVVSNETLQKITKAQDKPVEAVVRFSKAVDAYDNKNYDLARKDLAEAKKLDPANDAVKVYMMKLFKNTTKFKVMPERYISYQNPAFLSLLETDSFYVSSSSMTPAADPTLLVLTPGSELGASERASKNSFGYFLPVLKGFGVGIESFFFNSTDTVTGPWSTNGTAGAPSHYYRTDGNNYANDMGVIFSAGLKLTDNLSLGLGASVYNQERSYYLLNKIPDPPLNSAGYNLRNYPSYSYDIGLLLKDNTNTVFFDSYFAATSENFYLYSSALNDFNTYRLPSVLESTLSCALNNGQTFLVLKQYNYLYSDINYYIGSVMPAAEQWFFNTFSLRAGYEFSYFDLSGVKSSGGGYTLGASIPIDFIVKVTLDVNYTTRQRASRNLEGLKIDESILFFTVSFNDLFKGKTK